ncbi:tryptophan--tRNA ligase, partial [Escherichia coli]
CTLFPYAESGVRSDWFCGEALISKRSDGPLAPLGRGLG